MGCCPEPASSQMYPLLLSCSARSCPCADVALQANFARLQCQLISARIKSKGGRVRSMVDLSQRLGDGIDVGEGGNQDIPCTSQPRMVSLVAPASTAPRPTRVFSFHRVLLTFWFW